MPFADGTPTIDDTWLAETKAPQPFGKTPELPAFQLRAHHFGLRRKRLILSLDKGTGKTIAALSIFERIANARKDQGFTVLILTTGRGISSYTRDLKKFPGYIQDKFQVVSGSSGERERQWRSSKATYFIATYDTWLADIGGRVKSKKNGTYWAPIVPAWVLNQKRQSFDAILCDEFHRKFRNRTSSVFEWLKKLTCHTEYMVLMSGSAVSKGPQDLWPALHLVDPKFWSSYWKYVGTWCIVDEGPWGKKIRGPDPDKIPAWRDAVRPYVFHRTKDMLGNAMVGKNRGFLDYELPDWQRKLYDALVEESMVETPDGDFIFAQNSLTKLYKLRLCLICPKSLNVLYGVGGGIEAIVDDALDSELDRFAIFTPFRAPIPILADYLASRGIECCILQGGIGVAEQERRLESWRNYPAAKDRPICCLYTIKYGESWEIPEARYGYGLGYEWDPEENKQAEDRLHRLISQDVVYVAYTRAKDTYDEELVSNLILKAEWRELTWGTFKTIVSNTNAQE